MGQTENLLVFAEAVLPYVLVYRYIRVGDSWMTSNPNTNRTSSLCDDLNRDDRQYSDQTCLAFP